MADFLKHIEAVRQKPEGYRKKLTFILSGLITAFIFSTWLFLLVSSGSQEQVQAAAIDSPWSSFKSAFSQNVSDLKAQIADIFSSMSSSLTSSQNTVQNSSQNPTQNKGNKK